MEIVGVTEYNKRDKDCPYVLSMILKQRYNHIPVLGCNIPNNVLMNQLTAGLKKDGMKYNLIYSSSKMIRDFIDTKTLKILLKYLVDNKKDGFFVFEHNNPKTIRHIVGFLYNDVYKTLDFFDSYERKVLYTLRMDKKKIDSFIKDFFHTYFKDEFVIERLYEFNQCN